jgi:hypothetical protein
MASVDSIEKKARAGDRCYRGWRDGFDTHGVLPGDQVVIGGHGVHVETVREVHGDHLITNGGNTSSGSAGSQSNGGGAFRRRRSPGEVTGFALVDHVVDVVTSAAQERLTDVTPAELTPDELAYKRAGDQEIASPSQADALAIHQRIDGLPPDPQYPSSDEQLPPELLDHIAATDEAARAAEAAEEALVGGQEPAEDPADGIVLESVSPPPGPG